MSTRAKYHLLMIDADLSGHHEVYLENLAHGALKAGFALTIAISDSDKYDAAFLRLSKSLESVRFVRSTLPKNCYLRDGAVNDIRREFAFRRYFENVYHKVDAIQSVDHVFLPFFDHALNAIGLCGSPFRRAKLSGIAMRPRFHLRMMGVRAPNRKMDYVKKFIFSLLLSRASIENIFSIDETLFLFASRISNKKWNKIKFINDPAVLSGNVSKSDARAKIGVDGDVRLVLVYGAIDSRKGILQLLESIRLNHNSDMNIVVVVAGRFSEEVKCFMATPDIRAMIDMGIIFPIDRRISDEEEQILLSASDAVWVGYIGHFTMSGVIVKALIANRTILACEDGLIGWHASRVDNAIIFDPCDLQAIQSVLLKIPPSFEECGDAMNIEKYSWRAATSEVFGPPDSGFKSLSE